MSNQKKPPNFGQFSLSGSGNQKSGTITLLSCILSKLIVAKLSHFVSKIEKSILDGVEDENWRVGEANDKWERDTDSI